MEKERSIKNECYNTATQMFKCCGTEVGETIKAVDIVNKSAAFVTDELALKQLQRIIDPAEMNPMVDVDMLANALYQYEQNCKSKIDLDESFHLKCDVPLDSDSGISSDGFHLEELQCEVREKTRTNIKLRSEMDAMEDALQTYKMELSAVYARLSPLIEENKKLLQERCAHEEVFEQFSAAKAELEDVRRQLASAHRKIRVLEETCADLDEKKTTLTEQLQEAKKECHRINEMYSSRQLSLLGQNETLTAQCADLAAKLSDSDALVQRVMTEKIELEMELKDMVNKSNNTHLRFDRSIDVSFVDDNMLLALDTLNSDSQFKQDIFELHALKHPNNEDQARPTNLSLFDEIRLSFDSMSKNNSTEFCKNCSKENNPNLTNTDENMYRHALTNKFNYNVTNDSIEEFTSYSEDELNSKEVLNANNKEIEKKEETQKLVEKGSILLTIVEQLNAKLREFQSEYESRKELMTSQTNKVVCAGCQTDIDMSTVATQADNPCSVCVNRAGYGDTKTWGRYAWDKIKSLFCVLAGLCCVSALIVLYNVTNYHYAARRCVREHSVVPWRWFNMHDILDFFFRIEYIGEVPM